MKDRVFLHRRIPFEKSPDFLVERSHEILKKVGYTEKFADSAYGFMENSDLLNYIESSDKRVNKWKNLDAKAILFWYRQSPRQIQAQFITTYGEVSSNIGPENPPMQFLGEVLLKLDTEGHLVSLRSVPPQVQSKTETAPPSDWKIFFAEAGLDFSRWTPADAQWSPLSYADTRTAWQGSLSNRPDAPVRIEAAAFQGKPVSFDIIGPWSRAAQMESVQVRTRETIFIIGVSLTFVPAIVGGIFFARRNLKLGRGDRRNATRLALFVLGLSVLAWVFRMPRDAEPALFLSPYTAVLLWVFYMAIEPFVRRRWPQVLVSWTRLLSGEWRDPLVARDTLVGFAFGVLLVCTRICAAFFPSSFFAGLNRPPAFAIDSILGTRFSISELLSQLLSNIFVSLASICLLVIVRILMRNQKAAITVCILLSAIVLGYSAGYAVGLIWSALYFFLLMRFGLIAATLCFFANGIIYNSPLTFRASAWYSGCGFVALAVFAAIVLYAFRTSLGGRPLLAPSHLDD